MLVKKDMALTITHRRKGTFTAIALKDFDTETTQWYPVALAEEQLGGAGKDWIAGEEVPCRASFVSHIEAI